MGKKISPINVSHMERAGSCALGEKVRVQMPGQTKSFALRDITYPSNPGADQYFDFDSVKGMTFYIPDCACTGSPIVTRITPVRTREDFIQLRGDLGHSVWMENYVCWRTQIPSSVPPVLEETTPRLPDSILQNAFRNFVVKETAATVSTAMESLKIGIQGIAKGAISTSLMSYLEPSQDAGDQTFSATMLLGEAAESFWESQESQSLVSRCEELWIDEECADIELPDF